MKNNNKVTGNRGENIATEYLLKKGYKIEERNFRTRFGEIDIVCWDGQILVFVEVKTKIGHDFGEPEEMFNKNKMSQVKRMGEIYIIEKKQKLEKANYKKLVPVMPDLIRHPGNYIDSGSVPGMTSNNKTSGVLQGDSFGGRWNGGCRVDMVGIVLTENGEIEKLEHYEAVY